MKYLVILLVFLSTLGLASASEPEPDYPLEFPKSISGIPMLQKYGVTSEPDRYHEIDTGQYDWAMRVVEQGYATVTENELREFWSFISKEGNFNFAITLPDETVKHAKIQFNDAPLRNDQHYIRTFPLYQETLEKYPNIVPDRYETISLVDHSWLRIPVHDPYSWKPMPESAIVDYKRLVSNNTHYFEIIDGSNTRLYNIQYAGISLESNKHDIQSPLKQFKSGIPIDKIQCNDGLQLFIKNDGFPVCVKSNTASSLSQRQWGIHYESLVNLVANSDAIITGMVVGEDSRPNGERHVWLGSYEWLKKGKYDDLQLFLEQTKQQSGNGFSVPFERGEEVLLFLKNVDVKRGAYDLVDSEKTPAKKYPVKMRDNIVTFFDHGFFDENINRYDPDEEICSEMFLEDDSYYYCTTKSESYVPVEKLAEKIKKKMLEKISSGYYEEHFDLKVISDQPDVVFEPGPNSGPRIIPTKASGQNIEFVYTIDDVNFNYFLRTDFDNNQNQMYLQYHPPREVKSIISNEDEINKLIYSCLEKDMYKFPYKPFHVAYHIEDGLSPVIEGHGPPTIYDRWGDTPVQEREKIFRVWLATGKVDCADVHQEFDPDNKKRQEKILLFDSAQLGKLD